MTDSEFFETVGTKTKKRTHIDRLHNKSSPEACEEVAISSRITHRRWAQADDVYWPASETCETLEAGFYKFDHRPQTGPCLQKITIATDNLIRLPDTATEEVLTEFSTFWGLKDRFTERGFLHKRGILLWGSPGCLGAETMIHYQAFNDGRVTHVKDVTIERLYQLFHRIAAPGKGRYHLLAPTSEICISSVDDKERIHSSTVQNVIHSGVKPVYRVRTRRGLEIVATQDHKFLGNGEYICLGNLKIGDQVQVHVNTIRSISETGLQTGRKFCYVTHHPIARTKRLNVGEIGGLEFLHRDLDVHHKDNDCTNDEIENLQVLHHREHARLHGTQEYVASSDEIVSIEFIGEQETYDIQMAGPHHNFVANNFIVHNSGKTASLMLMAEDIIHQHAGIVCEIDNPQLAATCLSFIRKIEPARRIVAFLEDIDALVDRHGENNFLSLLDGETQINNIIYVATTNYPERLDKRFVDRPSRFDTVKWIGMPSAKARRVYLRSRESSLDEELESWVAQTKGFSVAHLRELVILVKCFEHPLAAAIKRLEAMRMSTPSSDNAPDRPAFGIGGRDRDHDPSDDL